MKFTVKTHRAIACTYHDRGCCLLWLPLLLLLSSCANYTHQEPYEVEFLQRAQTYVQGNVEVTAAVLSADESSALFGAFVAETGIQPVWIRIRNNDSVPYWLFSVSVDPEYFSPHEAGWKNHFTFGAYSNVEMDSVFRKRQIHPYIPAGETVSGFVYTHLNEGVKTFSVDLKAEGSHGKTFFFFTSVPGFKADNADLDIAVINQGQNMVELNSLEELRQWIEDLPCCVFGADGVSHADPLNLVMVGRLQDILPAYIMRGWNLAESAHFGAIWKMIKSFVFATSYRYSPVSPLYLYGRKQDLALQKARKTIDERNHLRLWVAPALYRGTPIMVGQISRDIGVRLTWKLSPPTTHVIDPEVDEARWYLEQDLLLSQRIKSVGLAKGVGYAPASSPRHNLMGDPYYTDGLRLVAFFTDRPWSFMEVKVLNWEMPEDIRYLHQDYD